MREELDRERRRAGETAALAAREIEGAQLLLRELNDKVVTAEGETRQLRSLLEHERSNTEELVQMARQNGEIVIMTCC